MRNFDITNKITGESFGIWDGETSIEAIDRMAHALLTELGQTIDRSTFDVTLCVYAQDIHKLGQESHEAGDYAQRSLCYRALDGDTEAHEAVVKTIRLAFYQTLAS